jgi:hypothetical protein
LLAVPSAGSKRRRAGRPRSWNLLSDLAGFCHRYPAWIGADGYPLSWGHFVIGLRRMAADRNTDAADMTRALRIAQATQESYDRGIKRLDEAAD